ncbi:hypothetical protein D3C85_496810 [compost metagenome]
MGQRGQGLHVVHVAGLVVDVGEHDHRSVLVNRLRQLLRAVDQTQGVALLQHVRQTFGDIQVSREVAGLGDDHPPRRRPRGLHAQGGAEHLEQVDRGGVGHHHFAVTGANQPSQSIAQTFRQVAPASAVPTADQAIAPFLGDHCLSTRQRCDRARAQGVAVEIDHPFRERKLLTQRGQSVLRIERQTIVSCSHWVSCFFERSAVRANRDSRV